MVQQFKILPEHKNFIPLPKRNKYQVSLPLYISLVEQVTSHMFISVWAGFFIYLKVDKKISNATIKITPNYSRSLSIGHKILSKICNQYINMTLILLQRCTLLRFLYNIIHGKRNKKKSPNMFSESII